VIAPIWRDLEDAAKMGCSLRSWFVKPAWLWKLALALLSVWALSQASARAQGPAPQYVVSGVRVDVSAQNATQARTKAFTDAPLAAWSRLVDRLMLDANAARPAPPAVEQMNQMVLSITVENERRSGTRYIGTFAVNFRGEPVRAYLSGLGLQIVDQRGQALLVAPVAPNAPPAVLDQWRAAWRQGGFQHELRPLTIAPDTVTGTPDWTQAASAANAAASPTAVYASVALNGSTFTADLTEVGPNGFRRERGRVSAQVRGGEAGFEDALRRLAGAANRSLQDEHKALLSTGAAPRAQRVTASAMYGGVAEWMRIKRGLDAAEDAMVRDVRIEAIHREGALVSFATMGTPDQLTAELQRHGVVMEAPASGAILRAPGPR
jgi:hypothetical protein